MNKPLNHKCLFVLITDSKEEPSSNIFLLALTALGSDFFRSNLVIKRHFLNDFYL